MPGTVREPARLPEPVNPTDPWQLDSLTRAAASGAPLELEGLGRYVILRPIGLGGMGVVLAAYDPSLDRKVAIKVLREGLHAGSEGAARMQREAQSMARLSHPNVAQVYEVGEASGRLYLVMEYVEGVTLREWSSERPRTMEEILRCFMEAGRGLAAAHAAGLVHRDFKPEARCPAQTALSRRSPGFSQRRAIRAGWIAPSRRVVPQPWQPRGNGPSGFCAEKLWP